MDTRTALLVGTLLIGIPATAVGAPFRFPEGRDGRAELNYMYGHSIEHYIELARWARTTAPFGVVELRQSLHAVSDRDMTRQTMVFDPVALRLHLSIGAVPASAQEFRVLELGRLLLAPLAEADVGVADADQVAGAQ